MIVDFVRWGLLAIVLLAAVIGFLFITRGTVVRRVRGVPGLPPWRSVPHAFAGAAEDAEDLRRSCTGAVEPVRDLRVELHHVPRVEDRVVLTEQQPHSPGSRSDRRSIATLDCSVFRDVARRAPVERMPDRTRSPRTGAR